MNDVFADRTAAGRQRADVLAQRKLPDTVVLALQIGAPGNPELAVGAIADGADAPVLDRESLAETCTPQAYVERQAQAELREIARRVVLAVPVEPLAAVAELRPQVDELVCLCKPEFFGAVGAHDADFRQVQDEEVIEALARAAGSAAPGRGGTRTVLRKGKPWKCKQSLMSRNASEPPWNLPGPSFRTACRSP